MVKKKNRITIKLFMGPKDGETHLVDEPLPIVWLIPALAEATWINGAMDIVESNFTTGIYKRRGNTYVYDWAGWQE